MANQAFDNTILNVLERPLSSDLNAAQSEGHRDLRDYLLRAYARPFGGSPYSPASVLVEGFVADGFRAVPPAVPSLAVALTPGLGFMQNPDPMANIGSPAILGLNDLSEYSPVLLSATKTVALTAGDPGPGFGRVDLIQVAVDRQLTDVANRDIFNSGTLTFGPQNVPKTMTFDLLNSATGINYQSGTPFAYPANDFDSPAALASRPTPTPGYMPVCYVNVQPGAVNITASDIVEMRPLLLGPGAALSIIAELNLFGTTTYPAGRRADVSNLKLPPGIQIAVTNTGIADQSYYVYVLLGDPTFYTLSGAVYPFGNFGVYSGTGGSSPTTGIVDATLQTQLADTVQTFPAVTTAIGQAYIRFGFAALEATVVGPTVTTASIAAIADGNNPYQLISSLQRIV